MHRPIHSLLFAMCILARRRSATHVLLLQYCLEHRSISGTAVALTVAVDNYGYAGRERWPCSRLIEVGIVNGIHGRI